MDALDLRGKIVPEVGKAIMSRYDHMAPGNKAVAYADNAGPALRMWMIEAGINFDARQTENGHYQISFERSVSPALTEAPGLHHLVAGASGDVWAADRRNTIVRIDGHSGEVKAINRKAGTKASHLAVSPDGSLVYLADFAGNCLLVLDGSSLKLLASFEAKGGPQLPAVSESGIGCVVGAGLGRMTIVWPDDTKRKFNAESIEIGRTPHDQIISQDGKFAFASLAGEAAVVKVDLQDAKVVDRIDVGDGPGHLSAHPDGERLYVANTFEGSLSAITVDGKHVATSESGQWSHHPTVTPDGKWVWVANFRAHTLSVFDAETMEKVADLETEPYAHEVTIGPDGRYAVAPGFHSEFIRVYDVAKRKEIHRIRVGKGSPHAAFLPDGKTAWVTCSVDNTLVKVDLDAGDVIRTIQPTVSETDQA